MTLEEVKKFSILNNPDVDVVVLKGEGDEGDEGDGYKLYLCAYIKQLDGIIVESDSWDEGLIIKELNTSYGVVRKHFAKENNIHLPEKLNYNLNYVNVHQWLKQ